MVYYLSVAAWQTVMKFNSLKLWTILFFSGFPGGREVKKNLPANEGYTGDTGSVTRLRRSPGEEMATHASIPVWKIPWTEEPGELQSM